MLQKAYASGIDPLNDENIAVFVETGVVRMNELARLPGFLIRADLELQNLATPAGVLAEMNDRFVVYIEQGDSGVQVRNEQHIAPNVKMGRKENP